MTKIIIDNISLELIKNIKDAFNEDEFREKCTDYFLEFDYIVGDYAYNKLRLKGFYDNKNKKAKSINNIKDLDKYIKEYCSYGCKYYVFKSEKCKY
ncbi:MAG: DUF1027 domain-containing protein [Bacilli bacterium]|nr:DUF1027 domain-containing protein [Bacilli bacterium]